VLPPETIALLDRGYDSAWLWCQLATLPICGSLIRLKGNRRFYRPAPAPTGKRGAPRKHGEKLQPNQLGSQGDPSGERETDDLAGKPVCVRFWKQMHLRDAAWLEVRVIRVERPQAAGTQRDPRVSWFVWIGNAHVDLVHVALLYVHRFRQEHGYRFDKQSLLWADVRVRTPVQFERWCWLVAVAHNLLVLARDIAGASFHPWENQQREPSMRALCVGRWANCCHSWALLHVRYTRVENRQDEQKASRGAKLNAFLSFDNGPKSLPCHLVERFSRCLIGGSTFSRNSFRGSGTALLV
jgi:hypothetical protein